MPSNKVSPDGIGNDNNGPPARTHTGMGATMSQRRYMPKNDAEGIDLTIESIIQKDTDKISDKADTSVEIWIKAKLKDWDKDGSGTFSKAEVKEAMEEFRDTERGLKNLKWVMIKGAVILTLAILFMLGASCLALVLAKDTKVSESGKMGARKQNEVVVTVPAEESGYVDVMLNFDEITNEWDITDTGLRDMLTIGFTGNDRSFHFWNVAEITRYDSQNLNDDKLEIKSAAGDRLRYWESVGQTEVKWRGSTQWEIIAEDAGSAVNVVGSRRMRQEDDGDFELAEGEAFDSEEWPEGMIEPPVRRILKGGGFGAYGGGGARTGRSGGTYAASSAGRYGHHGNTGVYIGGTYTAWHVTRSSGSSGNNSWYKRRGSSAASPVAVPSAVAMIATALAFAVGMA